MAGIARREVEILVHATAPSRGQDDARYRSLAQAYLDFEPASTHGLDNGPGNELEEDLDAQASSQLQGELGQSTLESRESEASYRPEDELATASIIESSASLQNRDLRLETSQGLDSPVLSFSSALDNADSPVWQNLHNGSQKVPHGPPSNQQTPQRSALEIADSQPENNKAIPAFSSPTRILELYLQQVQSSGERSSSYGIARNDPQACGSSPELPYATQKTQFRTSRRVEKEPSLTSGTPSSPSPQKHQRKNPQHISKRNSNRITSTQDPAMSEKRKWVESSFDDSHTSSSAPTKLSIESSTVKTRITRSRKRQSTDGSVDEITRTKEVTSRRITMVTTSSAPSFEAKSSWAEKYEIRPPAPQTSTKDLTPDLLITPSLQQLAQKMPLTVLFRPKIQVRDLRPMERGHWIVKCRNWDPSVRKRCWECLGSFIGRGLGGWGVWCLRDKALDIIKVYCWGTIVGNIYLLLYMASESKIEVAGACWIGGDGDAIITMAG
jgi:hypothetical protein